MAVSRLLDILSGDGAISAEQLRLVLLQQEHLAISGTHRLVGELLLNNCFVDKQTLRGALAKQGISATPDLHDLLPYDVCVLYQIIPLRLEGSRLFVSAGRVLNEEEFAGISQAASEYLAKPIEIVVAATSGLQVRTALRGLGQGQGNIEGSIATLTADPENGALLKLLSHEILQDALAHRASDVHLDWYELEPQHCWISYRVDGDLKRKYLLMPRIMISLIRRMKSEAGMDSSESRRGQDGRLDFPFQSRRIDVRVASSPMDGGEYVVMRLLDPNNMRTLTELFPGHPDVTSELLATTGGVGKDSGMFLITGATGQGKSTTLYALMQAMALHQMNLVTVEDPVEYKVAFARQIKFDHHVYKSFAEVLPLLLRSDPDVIVLGEMRDMDTAQSGLRFAESGHLLMSTLHANDAFHSYERFINMLPETSRQESISVLANTVRGFMNQRLIKRICPICAVPVGGDVLDTVHSTLGVSVERALQASSHGCVSCRHSGFSGRVGMPEAIFFEDDGNARLLLTRHLLKGESVKEALIAEPGIARVYSKVDSLARLVNGGLVDYRHALMVAKV